jgi:hypothetical protein
LRLSETVCIDRWMSRLAMVPGLAASWARSCQSWFAKSRTDGSLSYGPLLLWLIQHGHSLGKTLACIETSTP